jgi:putative nucleotide binding protein
MRQVFERDEVIVHLLGEEYFTLLEAAVSERFKPGIGTRIYIGRDVPREILRIIRRIDVDELTENGRANLEPVIQKIVEQNEMRFVEFFNKSNPITPRLHALELIPGIGKKMLQKFLEEREASPLQSFEDIKKRTGLVNPAESISRRVLEELTNKEEKYRVFVREPSAA